MRGSDEQIAKANKCLSLEIREKLLSMDDGIRFAVLKRSALDERRAWARSTGET